MATLADANASAGAIAQRPPKMYIRDLNTLEQIAVQFNPAKLDESLAVEWAHLKPPGLSHEKLHYDHTGNHKISLELIYDSILDGDTKPLSEMRKFLLSLCYARKGAQSVREGEAPRLLFFWPALMSLTCVIKDVKFSHTRFNNIGHPTYCVITLAIEEIRDARLFSEDVRQIGTQRTSTAQTETDPFAANGGT